MPRSTTPTNRPTQTPLRLLFLADAVFEDLPGGSRVVAQAEAEHMARRGHQVTFLVGRHNDTAPADTTRTVGDGSIRVIRYSGTGQGMGFVRAGRDACARLLAESNGGIDIVQTHFAYAALGPLQALRSARKASPAAVRIPHIRSFYGPWDAEGWVEDQAAFQAAPSHRKPYLGFKNRLRRTVRHRVEANNLKGSDGVIVLSQHSKTEVLSFGYPDKQIHTIDGGVDTDRFTRGAGRAAARRSLGLSADRPLLLSVRRLAPRMGIDRLIEAMPLVLERFPEALLIVGGKGPQKSFLEARVQELGLGKSVRLQGFLADEQLADYYRAADLFVLPTIALEGFGLVTVEALACGTPVVGTPIGATPEILTLLSPDLLAAGAAPAALGEAIIRTLTTLQAPPAHLTADYLSNFAHSRYTWDRHVDALEALYRTALLDSASGKRRASR